MIKVALVDDHILLRDALATLINGFNECQVVCTAGNGQELIEYLNQKIIPNVVILDLNMPIMDGFETASWLKKNYPDIYVLMLTMYDSEIMLIRLLKAGVKGFLKKDIHPTELKHAIQAVYLTGYYYSNHSTGKLMNLFLTSESSSSLEKTLLSEEEISFLQFTCTDLTYKEIAQKMNLNPRGVDNLRDHLFTKLDVKSRVGLAMYSIKHGIVTF